MSEPENITLVYLRRLDGKLDQLVDAVGGLTQRMQAVETGLLELRRETVGLHGDVVQLVHRLDRLDGRVARIERRLDLVES
ncbi:MAG: hypothetical protein WAS21_27985 [Geminicoccaceae bacterium]